MLSKIKRIFYPEDLLARISSIQKEQDELKILMGKIMVSQLKQKQVETLHDVEFKVFSQYGDDGIVQFLVNNIEIPNKSFIEFGVENYREANTRFLLINNNWKGFIMDASENYIKQIKDEEIYWKYELIAKAVWITKDNINRLIEETGFSGEIGLLSIDIDGNDYWAWKAIEVITPIIVIMEYNSIFGIDRAITIPYDPLFCMTKYRYSNLYCGASLLSLCDLAEEKGYYFIGCNSNGNNAYFIKKSKIYNIKPLNPKEGYVYSHVRYPRNEKGKPAFIEGEERLELIKGMEVYNIRENKLEKL